MALSSHRRYNKSSRCHSLKIDRGLGRDYKHAALVEIMNDILVSTPLTLAHQDVRFTTTMLASLHDPHRPKWMTELQSTCLTQNPGVPQTKTPHHIIQTLSFGTILTTVMTHI